MTVDNKRRPEGIHLVLESSFAELEKAIDQAESFFSSYITDEDLLYKILMLVSEAVTNAIEHGNKMDAGKVVTMDLECKDDTFEVWVEDQGEGYDHEKLADPLSEEHLLDDGGRGIFLIDQLADSVTYELGGRRLGMLFNRNPGP